MDDTEPIAIPGSSSNPLVLRTEPEPLQIDMRRTAVIVVDMQNGYCSRGGYFERCVDANIVSRFAKIISPIQRMCKWARSNECKVIYIVTCHPADLSDSGGPDTAIWYKDTALNLKRNHPELLENFTIRGSWGAEIMEELRPEKSDLIVEKMRYSGFFQTNFDTVLKTYNLKYLFFTGGATNICLEATLRDAYYLGYFPILVSDAAMNSGPDSTQEATIFNVKNCYGWVITTDHVIENPTKSKPKSK